MNTPKKLVYTLMMMSMLSVSTSVLATANADVDWQPVSSEKLIRMPVKYMDASIQRNFQQSSLASGINALNTQIEVEVTRMNELQGVIGDSEGEQAVELKHQFLIAKSNYLELMHEKHQLSGRALAKKARLYQNVLKKLQKDKVMASDPVSADLIAKQRSARQRLNKTIEHVDQVLLQSLPGKESKYQQEYSENLSKISQLKQAIQRHTANENPSMEGQEMNREQYVRFLLANVDSDLALLDQEKMMLGYMAKLVAMDAQALEYKVSYGVEDEQAIAVKKKVRLAHTADLFIE